MSQTVPVVEATSDETVLPERVREALGELAPIPSVDFPLTVAHRYPDCRALVGRPDYACNVERARPAPRDDWKPSDGSAAFGSSPRWTRM